MDDDIKMDLTGIGIRLMWLTQWRVLANAGIRLRVPENAGSWL